MKNKTETPCPDEAATVRLASGLADRTRSGDIILLEGDLGAGKTAFARAFIRHLTGNAELTVPSPTFTLLQTYDTPKGPVWHFDLYRLKDSDEVFELGWDDALAGGIVLIEWPDKLGPHRPAKALEIAISPMPGNTAGRIVTMTDSR